jgi:predicted permease
VLSDLLYRVRALVRRRAVDQELADELRFHLERETDKHVAAGMSHSEATRRARLDFGGLAQVTEYCREARGVTFVETLFQDLRYGIRTMRRSTAFSCTAVATIALATAAIATVASLGDTLLWRRPPVDDAETVVAIGATRGRGRTDGAVSYPDYVAFRDHATTVRSLAAHYPTAPLFVAVDGNAREVNGAVVSANYFSLLGMQPSLGRFFREDEDRVPDRDHVVVVGYSFWQSWLGGASTALGSTLSINGVPFTIVGIAPPRPAFLTPMPVELYIPTMMLRVGYRWCDDSLAGDCTTLSMIGRLAPGRSVADAEAEFSAIMPAAWRTAPIGHNRGVAVRQPRGMSEDDREPRLVGTLAAVALLLLIVCCANLAGLLSAQSAAREAEFGIRVSLGAGPLRIVRQLLTESLLLSFAGGIGGLLLSRVFIGTLSRLLFSMDDEGHPLYYDFSPSTAVVVATVIAALAAGVLFSLVPALRAVRRPAARAGSARTTSARWSTGRWLLGAQAAVAVAMMATAALLASSAREVLAGRNYETSHVALIRVRPRLLKYTPERAQQFQRQVMRQLLALPSVESASMVGVGTVLGGGSANASLPAWPSGQHLAVGYNEIGPAYFSMLRTPILMGREFDDRDTTHSRPVAVVNQTLAARLWPDGRWIGSTVIVENTPREVVGVVADVSLKSRNETADPWAFTPFWQNPGEIDSRIAVRTAADPAGLLPEITRVVHQIDPAVPIAETITLPIRMAGLTRPVRVAALFVGYAAVLAVVLTAIGLYGTLAFAVSRRTKEIGIRLALGAARGQVVGSIVGEGLPVVLAGSAIGVLLAIAGSRIVSHLLYGSASADWLFYVAAACLVTGVGVSASLLPARRAATVDPIVALHQE